MSYEDNFLFQWYPTCHIFTMGSFEKRGAERGALTKLWMALKHKKLMKKTYCNDLVELRANKRPPFRPPFFKWSHGKNMTRGVSLEWKIILIAHLVRILQRIAWDWKRWQKIAIFCHDRSSKSAMISWNQLIFICGYESHARKVCNSSMDKPFEPRESHVCIFFEILVPGKGVRKGVRPLLYESWWLNAKFG